MMINLKMKIILITLTLFAFSMLTNGQNNFTSRIGSKFFPGHLDIVVTLDNNSLRYELFNHWYASSYAELRQMNISLDSLDLFNQTNDTIALKILDNKIQLIDKRYNINKRIRHTNLCASPDIMRKISYAYKVSSGYKDIRHYELYTDEDLKLNESEFKTKIIVNLNKIKK